MFRGMKVGYVLVFLTTCAVLTGTVVGKEKEGEARLAQSRLGSFDTNACPYSFGLAKKKFTQQEPIPLTFAITNTYEFPISLSLGYDREGAFIFAIKQPNGSTVEIPPKQARVGLARLGLLTIEPQHLYAQQLVLNEWFAFTDPGSYEIAVDLKDSRLSKGDFSTSCQSTRIAIEVVPLDVPQLQHACDELEKVVSGNVADYAKASEAARALVAVRHPIVVPFLEKALESNSAVATIVISGLEGIGNDEAVRVLISVLEHSDFDHSEFVQARAALLSIQKRAVDPTILQSIRIALAKAIP